ALQNTLSVSVRFLAWQLEQMPLAAVVLLSLAAGLGIAGGPLWLRHWRRRCRRKGRDTGPAAPPEGRRDHQP
ncbi:MAG: LapA family protein, partial [Candidatus Rokubacteria bacterium]|nr:LapA family protein [Candidatus Rokubacteria bacterium]